MCQSQLWYVKSEAPVAAGGSNKEEVKKKMAEEELSKGRCMCSLRENGGHR